MVQRTWLRQQASLITRANQKRKSTFVTRQLQSQHSKLKSSIKVSTRPPTNMPDVQVEIPCVVFPVSTPEHLQQFKSQTLKYLEWLAEDLCFQGIDDELAGLPGCYATETGGTMLVAYEGDACVGAVALRPLQGKQNEGMQLVEGLPVDSVSEMKRLFVQPSSHGRGIGRALALAVMQEAKQLGYKAVVLDTLERLTGANQLYQRLGFRPCEPYNHCPLPGVLYWIKQLEQEK